MGKLGLNRRGREYNLSEILLLIGVFVAVISLQIEFVRREKRHLGLILPILSLVCSAGITFVSMCIARFERRSKMGQIGVGGVIQDNIGSFQSPHVLRVGAVAFLISNIPTVIMLLIYIHYKKKHKKSLELDAQREGKVL